MSAFSYIIRIRYKCGDKMKKNIAFNSKLFLFMFLTAATSLITAVVAKEAGTGFTFLMVLLSTAFVVGVVIVPKLYVADEEGISIYYLPFVKEYFKWDEIKRIRKTESTNRPRRNLMLDFLFADYEIVPIKAKEYKGSKYHSIFHSSEISRTFMTRHIIKKYWDGEIEDDSFAWFKKRLSKESGQKIKYNLAEVKEKEKRARQSLKQIVMQYERKAELSGKSIDATCTYFIDDDDFSNRPQENYSYVAEIFVEKENDEERSFYIKQEILFVSYGKKQIKIIENKGAFDEISKQINEAIEQ